MAAALALTLAAAVATSSVADAKSKKKNEAPWAAIDARECPAWFPDAKFGIFIHWGLYSVPAWSPKGTYSEWYKYWLERDTLFGNGDFTGHEISDYHNRIYGKDFHYSGFAPMFKAENFDAGEWARLFKAAGAKYAVLTTKHHEGFALWPSKEASRDYGMPWNSVEAGPHRDLVGEYADSLRAHGVKVGTYFSLREWGDPLYRRDNMPMYLATHHYPQLKDLINTYRPDLIWSDGPDGFSEEEWGLRDFFTWLYNESPVADSVVVNDRWATWREKRRGDYFTREYRPHDMPSEKPWEECRGIGFSFGYNRNEDVQDYASARGLVHTLVSIVARGGNLLLGIGPDATGKIPPIMQERLLQMGKWLETNGEAIYATRPWTHTEQWSEGDRNWRAPGKFYVAGDAILKQTVDPDPGFAVKEVFFTSKPGVVYAILPGWKAGEFRIRDITPEPGSAIEVLGATDRSFAGGASPSLTWRQDGGDIVVSLPELLADSGLDYAYTLRIRVPQQ